MDFFAAGGFQQLFSDLHESQLDAEFNTETDLSNIIAAVTTTATLDDGQNFAIYEYELPQQGEYCSGPSIVTADADDPFAINATSAMSELPELLELHGSTNIIATLDCDSNNNASAIKSDNNNDICLELSEQVLQQSLDRLLDSPMAHNSPASASTCTTNDQLLLQHTFDEMETAAFITREMAEWEEKFLDNYIEIPELIDFLPEKTPLCTETCEHFLAESTQNLRLHRKPTARFQQNEQRDRDDKLNYPCTFGQCEKIYAKPAHLKAHMRRHLGEKPYICTWPDCTWKFSRSDELARHRRSHSGVKPYKCDYCLKCFARSDHLTKHRKVHERRLLAASKAGKTFDGVLPQSVFTVRPGRKRKNQIC